MKIIVNGETKEFQTETTLLEIMQALQIEDKVMAAAVNMNIVKKEQWNTFKVSENDKLELLNFVAGG